MNRETLIEVYLDWVNNYLTIEKFADHHGLHPHEAGALITLCKQVFEDQHPEA